MDINPETVCEFIALAREFHVREEADIDDEGSNATDDGEIDVLADGGEEAADPIREEMVGIIEGLNDDERNEMVALMWLGRGDYTLDEWDQAVRDAAARATDDHGAYLIETPLVPDYLTEGLAAHDLSCGNFDARRL